MKSTQVAIVGGGYAGVLAALRATRAGLDVTLVTPHANFSERIRLHEQLRGRGPQPVPLRTLLNDDVRVHQAHVTHIDLPRRTLETSTGLVQYDACIVAAGSLPAQRLEGSREHAFAVDAQGLGRLREAILARCRTRHAPVRVAVCGGGATAVELAAEVAVLAGVEVTLIADVLTPGLSSAARASVYRALQRSNIALVLDARITRIAERGREAMVESERGALTFDLCVDATGFRAAPLLGATGLKVNGAGQCLLASTLAVPAADGLFIAGDAGVVDGVEGAPMGCKSAMPMGAHAADNVARYLRGAALHAFSFRDILTCIQVGRGAVAVAHATREPMTDGSAERIWDDWRATFIKGFIKRYTRWALHAERLGLRYRWPMHPTPRLADRPARQLS
jgi:NADH dehydrogenase FAD-containing subunit